MEGCDAKATVGIGQAAILPAGFGWLIEEDRRPVQLPQLCIRLAGRERLLLDAFVYQVEGTLPTPQYGPKVSSAFWIRVAKLWS